MPVWQSIYEELKDEGLEILSAAQDTQGEGVAGPIFDAAGATFTCVVDVRHAVSAAFQLTNVPTAIWIDERGRIVRLDTGAYAKKREVLGIEVGVEGYREALRDWVREGSASAFVLPPEVITARLPDASQDDALAEQNFRLGAYFYERGDTDRATHYWEIAQRLSPDNWIYHRQEWVDSGFESSVLFLWRALLRATRGIPYYPPIELPNASAGETRSASRAAPEASEKPSTPDPMAGH